MIEAKTETVTMTVDALHILEQIAQEDEMPFGIKLGAGMIHGLLQKVASRAAELNDPQLNVLMLKLHLYDVPNVSKAIAEQEELIGKTKGDKNGRRD